MSHCQTSPRKSIVHIINNSVHIHLKVIIQMLLDYLDGVLCMKQLLKAT